MTPEMTGRQENTNQKRRMELTLDLINARVTLTGQQRNQIREILREQFASSIEEEREACAIIGDEEAGHHAGEMERLHRNDLAVTIEEKAMNTAKGIARRIRARSQP